MLKKDKTQREGFPCHLVKLTGDARTRPSFKIVLHPQSFSWKPKNWRVFQPLRNIVNLTVNPLNDQGDRVLLNMKSWGPNWNWDLGRCLPNMQ